MIVASYPPRNNSSRSQDIRLMEVISLDAVHVWIVEVTVTKRDSESANGESETKWIKTNMYVTPARVARSRCQDSFTLCSGCM